MAKFDKYTVRRLVGFLFLGIYLLVAMLNFSWVQSFVGIKVGQKMSAAWGGKVRVGAIHFSPISHVVLDDVELISPTNDTIFMCEELACRFTHFPYRNMALKFDKVVLRNAFYHFESIRLPSGDHATNLQFIVDYYASEVADTNGAPSEPFSVEVKELLLHNVTYRQDLPEGEGMAHYDHGVVIPHMQYNNVESRIQNVRVINDSVRCRMVSFATTEASGLHIDSLSFDCIVSPHIIQAENLHLVTDSSCLYLDARLTYDGWDAMSDYCNNVHHDVIIKPGSHANLCEAAYWAPALWGLSCRVTPQGRCHGTVSEMHAVDFLAGFGEESYVRINGYVKGLPDMSVAEAHVNVREMHVTHADLLSVQHPQPIRVLMPDLLREMNTIEGDAALHGGLKNCAAEMNLTTRVGDMGGRVAVRYDSLQHDYVYVGEMDCRTLGVQSILPNEWVSRTGMHIVMEGRGFDPQTMSASMEGRLFDTRWHGRNISRTLLSAEIERGVLSADVGIDDTLVSCDLSAAADLARHAYDLNVDIRHARLKELHLLPDADSSVVVTARIRADLQGTDVEHLSGTVTASGIDCLIGSREIAANDITITSDEHDNYKDLTLRTDWMTLALKGYFDYADLPLAARDFCDRYVPTYYNPFRNADTADVMPLTDASFDVDLYWDDDLGTFHRLLPNVSLAAGTSLHGNYNHNESLRLVFRSDSVAVGGVALHDVGFNTSPQSNTYQMNVKVGGLALGGSPFMENVRLNASAGSRISMLSLRWDDDASTVENEGDLEFFLTSTPEDNKLMVTKPTFYFKGYGWTIVNTKDLLFNNERIEVDNLKVYGLDQSLAISAKLNGSKTSASDQHSQNEDFVKVAFDDFSLDRISEMFWVDKSINVLGDIDGNFVMRGLSQTPYIESELTIDNCVVNNQVLGRVDVRSNWEAEENRLYLDLVSSRDREGSRPVEAHGTALLKGEDPLLDFYVDINNVDMKTLGPVLATVTSRIDGQVGGSFHFSGTPKKPQLDGTLAITDGLLQVDASGVTYTFADKFVIQNDTLTLKDFTIRDVHGNTAKVNGQIAYDHEDLLLDLALRTDRILVLDSRSHGNALYGRLFASATGTMTGTVAHPVILVNASTLDGCELNVPISNTLQADEQDFVHFVSYQPQAEQRRVSEINSVGDLRLQLNLTVTPGLRLHLPMDFSELSADVTAKGRGDIRFSLNGAGSQPTVLGDYEFASGTFSLNLLSLIEKNFTIEQGSTLNFPGSIDNARFDISAVYSQRVNLVSLLGASTSQSDSYAQVQDVIKLSGTMQNPSIKFDIRLPNADQTVSDQVFSYIDRNNERDMLNHSISLLMLGRFANAGIFSNSNNYNGLSSFDVLTTSMSSVMSNMIKVVDVNVTYQTGATANTGQLDVGISKEWDKFYFESSFGYGTGTNEMDATTANVLVGDVVAGYKINPYIHVYGFHRSNTSYYTRTELPYKQGAGFKWTKDFNTIYDLFPWLRKKKVISNDK